MDTPSFKEDHISQVLALELLQKLGYQYITPQEAFAARGGRLASVLLHPHENAAAVPFAAFPVADFCVDPPPSSKIEVPDAEIGAMSTLQRLTKRRQQLLIDVVEDAGHRLFYCSRRGARIDLDRVTLSMYSKLSTLLRQEEHPHGQGHRTLRRPRPPEADRQGLQPPEGRDHSPPRVVDEVIPLFICSHPHPRPPDLSVSSCTKMQKPSPLYLYSATSACVVVFFTLRKRPNTSHSYTVSC